MKFRKDTNEKYLFKDIDFRLITFSELIKEINLFFLKI